MRWSITGAARGEQLAGFVYGTIVVLSVIAAGARDYGQEPGHIAFLVEVTCVAFWLAHVYAHALGDSVGREQHLNAQEFKMIARREASIIEAAVPPVAALLLGTLHVIDEAVALWLAFLLGMIVLAAQGVVYARIERLGWLATAGVLAGNIALGLVLVGLKIFLAH